MVGAGKYVYGNRGRTGMVFGRADRIYYISADEGKVWRRICQGKLCGFMARGSGQIKK